MFAKHFSSVFNEAEDNTFNEEFKLIVEREVEEFHFDSRVGKRKFEAHELTKAFKELNNKQTEDPQGVSNFLLRKSTTAYKQLLLDHFNNCLDSNNLPESWKVSPYQATQKEGGRLVGRQELSAHQPDIMRL